MKTALDIYHARMQRALDYIHCNLDAPLDLDRVCQIAAFSKFHFHRQFGALFGVSLHRYIQLARMKRASYQLAYRNDQSVTNIAMDAGYDAPDAFARAFRQRLGQSPSAFRKSPDWEQWLAALGPLEDARSKLMQNTFTTNDVTVRNVSATPVAIMEHLGPQNRIGETLQRFIAWRKINGLSPKTSATFNIFHCDPRTTPEAEFRMSFCAGINVPARISQDDVQLDEIPEGRCAVLKITGSSDNLEAAANCLYRDWLPDSGEETRDFPLYCQRITFFPEVAEHEAVTELFLPLK